MTRTSSVMLNDTLNLIQLARETARLQGKQIQAETLKPVVDGLRDLLRQGPGVGTASRPAPGSVSPAEGLPPASLAEAGQSDFRTLLSAATRATPASGASAFQDRNGIVLAMAAGGMTELDIARQMGMTRDEIGMIVRLGNTR